MTSPLAGFLRAGEFALSVSATQPLETKVTYAGRTIDALVALFGSREARSELGLILLKKGRVLGKLKPLMALPVTRELSAVQREQGLELRWKDEVCCLVHTRSPVLSDLVTSRIAQMTRYQHDPFSAGSCTHKWIWHYADLFPKPLQTNSQSLLQSSDSLMPEHYDSEIMDTFIRQQLRLRQAEYTKVHPLSLFAVTWNCGGTAPRDQLRKMLRLAGGEPDLVIVGLQETCKLKASSTLLGDSERSQLWRSFVESEVSAAYSRSQYVNVESFSLVGMLLVVFGKAQLFPYIPRDETDVCVVKCGLKGRTGNKGAIGLRFRVFDTTICVVNCHLAAFPDNIQERNSQFHRIVRKLTFRTGQDRKPVKVFEHDVVLWLGDLNYRLSHLSLSEVVGHLHLHRYDLLLARDQLKHEIRKKCAFAEFQEADIAFPPTYKFQIDSANYYDGESRREPAWCDRILWRGELKCEEYSYVPDLQQSDHRPVYARFTLPAKVCDLEACRRVKMEILRLIDSAHQKCQPQVQLSAIAFRFPRTRYKQQSTTELAVTNVCPCMVKFKFKAGIGDKVAKSWLHLSPEEGAIAHGETAIVALRVYIDEKAARKAYWDPEYLNCVLVLSVVGGSDYFVDVHCDDFHSAFGSSCYDLVKMFEPAAAGKMVDSVAELQVPKELWRLLEYIVAHGAHMQGLFSESGTPEGLDAVRAAVDADEEFTGHADVHSACSVLLEWLHSLSVPVVPLALLDCFCNLYITEGSANSKLAEGFIQSLPQVAGRCFVAILAFLRTLLLHREENNLSLSRLVVIFTEALTQSKRVSKQAHEPIEDQWKALQLRRVHRYCFLSLYFDCTI